MNIDDPKLTAYALGELDEAEISEIARRIASSPEAQRFVADTQQLAQALRSQYNLELETESVARERFITNHDDSFWSKAGPLAIAAVLALLAVIGAVVFSTNRYRLASPTAPGYFSSRETATARPEVSRFGAVEAEDTAQPSQNLRRDADAGPYAYTGERPFVSVASRPRSTFPLLVNSASYLEVRRSINAGVLPSKDAVRIEEMINYFPYEYPQPSEHESFSLKVDVVACPWDSSHRLVRIGLNGRQAMGIADDSNIEVRFNPRRVAAYRLIGYDRQPSSKQSVNEEKRGSNRIPAEYTVTAFYEAILLTQNGATADTRTPGTPAEHLLSARLDVRMPDIDAVHSIERVVTDTGSGFADAPQDVKFAAAVAEFAMILRDSEYRGNATLEKVIEWAQEGKGADVNGYRADFIQLVRKAQSLKRG
ncbi:MAG TPA: von Willebrand factor type A domain-containing protein [Candidatus Udaeobacter sp.]|nr:von Willebrand factor type A domain-containing protein [Candidatus Udaeobacter sp.]